MKLKNFMASAFILSSLLSAEAKSYDVCSYGAINDGKTLATQAINKAITDCNAAGGGTVVVPTGTYLTGTIILKDNVELYLERGSKLLGSTSYADYPLIQPTTYRSLKDIHGWAALIYADGAKNIAICGAGTIDGQGATQQGRPEYKDKEGDRDGRSRNILLISCSNIRIEGITMRNAAIWNHVDADMRDFFMRQHFINIAMHMIHLHVLCFQ